MHRTTTRHHMWCFLLVLLVARSTAAAPKKFFSEVVTRKTPDHRVAIEIDITGAKQLFLEVTDGGNGSGYDWADWIEPHLVNAQEEKPLTELKWKRVEGRATVGKNQGGGPLRVAGQDVKYGIGTHAPSLIVYDLPPGFNLFRVHGGLDNGGTDQRGSTTSVSFRVFTSAKLRYRAPLNMKVAPGFHAELLYTAGVGEIGSWVALGVDGKGRLIVSDRQGPMYRIMPPPLRTTGSRDEDRDEDYDEDKDEDEDEDIPIDVQKMPVQVGYANGILEAFGSLYVVGKGYGKWKGKSGLFRLTDTNSDDRYDKVEHLFSVTVGGDHHAHAVILSPTGERLYMLCGNSTNLPTDVVARHIQHQAEDHLLPRSTYYGHNTGRTVPGGFVLSFQPDGSDRRLLCGGLRNAYDIALNSEGELFTFDADMEYDVGGPWYRPTRVNHCVSGADFGWRWGAGKWPIHFPDTVGAVANIGRGSPTGVVFGYGARFPAKYQRALFIADWTYGRIFAVHMRESGATYTGESELFVSGRPLPVSDLVIHPVDGAMYFITGGRRNRTSLVRVTYVGEVSTTPVNLLADGAGTPEQALRKLRRQLEQFHGSQYPGAVPFAWPHLAHKDRAIRFAARTVIEHQPTELWLERAMEETRPLATIEAMVALARRGDKSTKEKVEARLNALDFNKMAREQQLDVLRAYGLCFIRLGKPSERTAKLLTERLSPRYPSGDVALDHELCQMLLYLGAPRAITKTLDQLLCAVTQANQMFYAYHLRTTVGPDWQGDALRAYFTWIRDTERKRGDYTGGGHFANFLKMVRRESLKRLEEEERKAVSEWLKESPAPAAPPPALPMRLVQEWTVADLKPALGRVDVSRSFLRGKKLYTGLCSKCHLFNGKGGALGPDLTSAGNKLSYEALLTEIIEPSKVLSDQYASVIVQLKNGDVITGREVGGDERTIRIADNADKPDEVKTVEKASIVLKKTSPTSMMPTGLVNVLKDEEILDLLMYVASGGKVGNTAFDG